MAKIVPVWPTNELPATKEPVRATGTTAGGGEGVKADFCCMVGEMERVIGVAEIAEVKLMSLAELLKLDWEPLRIIESWEE